MTDAAGTRVPAPQAPPEHPRRLVYLGTPAIAVAPLEALHAAGFEVALVVTGADKRRGRGGATTPTPVKAAAERLGLPVAHDIDAALEVAADLGVVMAYGRLIRRPVLERLPMVNLHVSLLPRWRGAAPVERAILAGDERTGVCLMAVDETLDTGDVYARAELAIGPDETAEQLRVRLAEVGAELVVSGLRAGLSNPEPQRGGVTYAEKITPDDLRIDWSSQAERIHRQVRLGGAWTTWRGKRLKVRAIDLDPTDGSGGTDAADQPRSATGEDGAGGVPGTVGADATVAVGDGRVRLVEVQPEGKASRAAIDWVRGARPADGEAFA